MGRGGQNQTRKMSSVGKKQTNQLKQLSTEELRKWGKEYNIDKYDTISNNELIEELVPYAAGVFDKNRPLHNFPLKLPKFTLKTIRDAIPKECFKRSLSKSLYHLGTDCLKVAILGYLSSYISTVPGKIDLLFPAMAAFSMYIPYVLWPMYWIAQGCCMTGIWVLAHECGHQAFSDSQLINNTIGTIFHSLLLVPYHPWRITHGLHHNNTGSCDNDEVFAPSTRTDWKQELRETPMAHWWGIFVMLVVGWWPGYLIFNITGPKKYEGKDASHLSPTAVFIDPKDYWLVIQSDIALGSVFAGLAYCIYMYGFTSVGAYYIVPEMIVNLNLVLITYLQHTDVYMPHFRNKEWSWLRGAMCTVDREYGWLYDRTLHHITDTHVCHHLFSTMPFYNAQIATPYIKEVLGDFYLKDNTPVSQALYRSYSSCQFVENVGDIIWYKNVK